MSAAARQHVDGTGGFGETRGRLHRAHARLGREGGQPGPEPGDPVPRADRLRDRALADPRLGERGRHQPDRRRLDRRRRGRAARTASARCPTTRAARTTRSTTETIEAKGLLTGDGIRFMFTSFVPELPRLRGGRRDPRRDDRRRRRRVLRADRRADPQARRDLLAGLADLHHRLRRDPVERRVRRRLPRADPAGGGRVHQRRPPSARRASPPASARSARRSRSTSCSSRPTAWSPTSPTRRPQLVDPNAQHRPRREPLVRDRLDAVPDRRDRAGHHADHRAAARHVGPRPGRRGGARARGGPGDRPGAEAKGLRWALFALLGRARRGRRC